MDTPLTPRLERRARARGDRRRRPAEPAWPAVFDVLPVAALVLDVNRRVLACNAAAEALLGPRAALGARCCELLGCRTAEAGLDDACVARLARGRGEVRVEPPGRPAVWLAARPAGPGGEVVVTLRPVEPAGEARAAGLTLLTLGCTRLEADGRPVEADWLSHRPGLLLKYLARERGRVVALEELLEVFWPDGGRAGASNVRQAIHTLRARLQPDRPRGTESSFVLARRGGYELARDRIAIDADDFEARARAGLQAFAAGAGAGGKAALLEAVAVYGGDFLADEPYAEWALPERERLRDLAAQVLRALAELERGAGDLEAATAHLLRLAELEPLDLAAQRELIAILIRRGRHSEALRRFELVRRRYKRAFGEEPGFTPADLTR